jgi:hypothetical protein
MARNEWLGNALAIAQVSTITIANTWATNDTVTVTINGKAVVVTVGAAATTAGVAAALKAALAGDALVGTETRNTTGDLIPEFKEFVATVSGSVVTLTGITPGMPFTVAASESTTGSGMATAATATAATGPNHVDNILNWSLGAIPVDTDDVVIATPVSLLYGLTSLAAVTPGSLTIPASFWASGARIGLPKIHGTGSSAYNEYRALSLQFDGTAAGQIGTDGGSGGASGQTFINLDFGTGNVDLTVHRTGTPADPTRPAVCLTMLPTSVADAKLEVLSGSVGVGFYGETCKCLPRIGYRTNVVGDSVVVFGTGVTIGATFEMSGGTVTLNTATTAINKTGGELTINGAGAHPIVDNFTGALYYNSTGALGGTRVKNGGLLDFSRDMSAKTVSTTIQMVKGSELNDPHGVVASLAFNPTNCRLADVTVRSPVNKTFTLS